MQDEPDRVDDETTEGEEPEVEGHMISNPAEDVFLGDQRGVDEQDKGEGENAGSVWRP